MTRESFIKEVAADAVKVGNENHVLPSVILAQAILESDSGESGLAKHGYNLFGVKGTYQGQSITLPTQEYVDGRWVKVDDAFKKYPSWAESFEDLCALYTGGVSWDHAHYKAVLGETDYKKACHALQTAGYATDPNYANLLIGIIEGDNLTEYDRGVVDKPQEPAINSAKVYIVKQGDNLSKIAKAYKTNVTALLKWNPDIKDKNLIHPGQEIHVASPTKSDKKKPAAKPAEKKTHVYVVKRGDTFSEIAAHVYPSLNPYKGGMDKLHAKNPQIKNIGSISVGEVINY